MKHIYFTKNNGTPSNYMKLQYAHSRICNNYQFRFILYEHLNYKLNNDLQHFQHHNFHSER